MILRRILTLGALAACFMLATGTSSQAAYSYTTAITITSATGALAVNPPAPGTNASIATSAAGSTLTSVPAGVTVTLGNITSAGLIGANTVNIGTVQVQTSNATPQTFGVLYTDVITITNPIPGGATGTFTINGTMSIAGLASSGGGSSGTITNLYNGVFSQSKTIGTLFFTMSFGDGTVNDFFGPPTVNGALGSLGANINSVPEPTSLAILGTGLVGVVGLGLRRAKKSVSKRA